MNKETILRINQLAQKKRNQGLTEEEVKEQQHLRQLYLNYITTQVKDQLEHITLVDRLPDEKLH